MLYYLPFLLFFIGLCSCQSNFVNQNIEIIKESAERMMLVQNAIHPQEKVLANLTIQDCIQTALSDNADYTAITHRILQAHAALAAAKAELLPILTIHAGYFHADYPSLYFNTKLDQHRFNNDRNWNNSKDFGSSQLAFSFQEKLSLSGREFLEQKSGELKIEISQLQEEKARNDLAKEIIYAYYDILSSQQYINIIEESAIKIEKLLQEENKKNLSKSDILILEIRLAIVKELFIKAKNNHALAKNSLLYLMGFPPDTSITLTQNEVYEIANQVPLTYQEGLAFALANRPEIGEIRRQVLVAKYGIDIEKSYYWPDLEFFGKYSWEDRDFKYSKHRDNWQIGIAINWNIFDGMRTYSKVWQAEEMHRELSKHDKKTVLEIQHEVNAAYKNWQESIEREKLFEKIIEESRQNLNFVDEFKITNIQEYLNAEAAYTQIQLQRTYSKYDLYKAKATISRALGLPVEKKYKNF